MTLLEAKLITLKTSASPICITCEVWIRGVSDEVSEFRIWDGGKSYLGRTLEIAMGKFLAANPVLMPADENPSVAEGFFAEVQPGLEQEAV